VGIEDVPGSKDLGTGALSLHGADFSMSSCSVVLIAMAKKRQKRKDDTVLRG